MKKLLTLLASVLTMTVQAQTTHDWENPAVLGINLATGSCRATANPSM